MFDPLPMKLPGHRQGGCRGPLRTDHIHSERTRPFRGGWYPMKQPGHWKFYHS